MNSRERVTAARTTEPDRVPLDLGASAVTGMQVSSVYLLRQALKLDPPGTPVKVVEPYQMLGEIAPDLMDALGVDVVGWAAAGRCSASAMRAGSRGRSSTARQCSSRRGSTPIRKRTAAS